MHSGKQAVCTLQCVATRVSERHWLGGGSGERLRQQGARGAFPRCLPFARVFPHLLESFPGAGRGSTSWEAIGNDIVKNSRIAGEAWCG